MKIRNSFDLISHYVVEIENLLTNPYINIIYTQIIKITNIKSRLKLNTNWLSHWFSYVL